MEEVIGRCRTFVCWQTGPPADSEAPCTFGVVLDVPKLATRQTRLVDAMNWHGLGTGEDRTVACRHAPLGLAVPYRGEEYVGQWVTAEC